MSRDEKLKANQRRLAAKRRAKRMAQAMTKKSATEKPKTSKPKTSSNTKVAFDKKTNFGDYSLKSKPKPKPIPQRTTPTPPVTQEKKKDPPKPTPTRTMPSNPQLKSQPGGTGTQGRPMPSNPQVGYSKPVRRNFKTKQHSSKLLRPICAVRSVVNRLLEALVKVKQNEQLMVVSTVGDGDTQYTSYCTSH